MLALAVVLGLRGLHRLATLHLVDGLLRLVGVQTDRERGRAVGLGHVSVVALAENTNGLIRVRRLDLERHRVGVRRLPVRRFLACDLDVLRALALVVVLALLVVRALAVVLGLRRLHRLATLHLVDRLLRLVAVRREPDGGRVVRLRDVAAVTRAEHADRRGRVARLPLNGLRVCIGALVVLRRLACDLRRARAVARARLGLVDRLLRLVAVRREPDCGRGVRLRDVAVVARAEHADRRGRVARPVLHSLRVRIRGLPRSRRSGLRSACSRPSPIDPNRPATGPIDCFVSLPFSAAATAVASFDCVTSPPSPGLSTRIEVASFSGFHCTASASASADCLEDAS